MYTHLQPSRMAEDGCTSDYYPKHVPKLEKETRRHQQAQAAERRMREQESRGIKDPDKVKRMQQKSENIQRMEDEAARHSNQGGGLKWQVN